MTFVKRLISGYTLSVLKQNLKRSQGR